MKRPRIIVGNNIPPEVALEQIKEIELPGGLTLADVEIVRIDGTPVFDKKITVIDDPIIYKNSNVIPAEYPPQNTYICKGIHEYRAVLKATDNGIQETKWICQCGKML